MKMVIGKKLVGKDVDSLGQEINETSKRNGFIIGGAKKPSIGMQELKSLRGQRSKFFSDGQQKMRAEFYDVPVHYYDEDNGEFKEINNCFKDCGEVLETRANSFKSRFHKGLKDGKIFEMEKNLCKVGLKSLDVMKRQKCDMEVCECGTEGCDCNKVLVNNVSENADIEYIVESERIKENIIVKERAAKYEYDFDISLENLSVGVSADGKSLELTKKDTGRLEFYIPSPVMYDSNGERSEAVYYEIEQDDTESIKIKVIADAEWINSESRVFPVIIDPQIVSASYAGYYYTDSNYQNSIFNYTVLENGKSIGGDPRLYYNNTTKKDIYTQIVIKKNMLPSYMRNNFTNVTLKLRARAGGVVKGFSVGYGSYSGNGQTEFLVDITQFFYTSENEIIIPISNCYYRGSYNENDFYFNPPVLMIEYSSHVVGLTVTKGPNKKSYIPGEKFDKTGMVVQARYEDGSTKPVALSELNCEPSGTLASYDKSVKITYKGEGEDELVEYEYKDIKVDDDACWFNDRRANKDMENYYIATMIDANGKPTSESYKISLELADGVDPNSQREGTPLNAETFNKIIKALKDKGIL